MVKKLPVNIKKTPLQGLFIITRPVFEDQRGFFHELYRSSELQEVGINFRPIQINHSLSKPKVIRAIHTEGWQKLIYPVTGKMFAAFVDVRIKSKTFGKVFTKIFDNTKTDTKRSAVFIPPGIGNSICVAGDGPVHYIYAVDQEWDNSKAQGIAWNDPDLNIKWPVKDPIVSKRDKDNLTMRQLFPEKYQ
ncbi:dTDP-4-dehydrorhamnose 3,5-epimerase family protein [Candidatus Woesebacteria bacterium]|nr:dTDP-4-dehydrorhamnose 3,5-epimerase family protein [Candidatus Woesebacteria bacterium]